MDDDGLRHTADWATRETRPGLQSARGAASGYPRIRWAGNQHTIREMGGDQSFLISDADHIHGGTDEKTNPHVQAPTPEILT